MTPTETTTLSDFLLARIAEDEAVARASNDGDGERWMLGTLRYDSDFDTVVMLDRSEVQLAKADRAISDHIVRHDPARVLAECEAKRRIVERCLEDTDPDPEWLNVGVSPEHLLGADVLKLLALPYADHPDYREEEWKL